MNPKELEKLEKIALAPLLWAERKLVEAENILLDAHKGQKSELRQRLEKFESNIEKAWDRACQEYGVKSGDVFALPLNVYHKVCAEWIQQPGQQLFNWISDKISEWNLQRYNGLPQDNPYILAICALQKSYNIFGVDDTWKEEKDESVKP